MSAARILLTIGRASTRLWLRSAPRDSPMLRRDVRAEYDRLSTQLPWPDSTPLRLHLVFSVLPGAACYRTLCQHGYTSTEAARIITDAMTEMAVPRHRVLALVVRTEHGRRAFMRLAGASLRLFPAPGWQARWVERNDHRVAFDMTRCFDLDMLARLDAAPIAAAYCAVDDVLYTDLHPELRWTRTGTLATGADHCDFCFEHLTNWTGRRPGPM